MDGLPFRNRFRRSSKEMGFSGYSQYFFCSLPFLSLVFLSLSLAAPSRLLPHTPFLCFNRLFNLPLIPRLSRFFSSFFLLSLPSFHIFVALVFSFSSFSFSFFPLPSSFSLLSLPFCIPSLRFANLSPVLSPCCEERSAPTGFETVSHCFGAKSRAQQFVCSFSRVYFFCQRYFTRSL